jgi:hypothetical protein
VHAQCSGVRRICTDWRRVCVKDAICVSRTRKRATYLVL